MKKKSNNKDGSLCSGYGVFPDGSGCKGCIDCDFKPNKSMAEIKKTFDRNHLTVTVGKNFDLEKELKGHIKKYK